jgi:uncharacterized RDD family membrane protein YckC
MQGSRAGIVSRFLADAIDLAVVIATLVGIYFAVAGVRFLLHPRRFTWPEPSGLDLAALGWVLLFAYLAIGWGNTGRTFGKTVLGLRVVGGAGGRLPFLRALLRSFLCVAFPIGLFWCVVSAKDASIADLIVRSSVVYDWEPRLPAAAP